MKMHSVPAYVIGKHVKKRARRRIQWHNIKWLAVTTLLIIGFLAWANACKNDPMTRAEAQSGFVWGDR